MIYLFLITHKTSRKQTIAVIQDVQKDVFIQYPVKEYMNELLEVCRDRYHVKDRMLVWQKTYPKALVNSPFSIKKDAMDLKFDGWKPSFDAKELMLRSLRMMGKFNPNFGGMTEEHKKKLSEAAKGKPGTNKGKKFNKEWRNKISESAKGNKAAKGLKWIHNPLTGEHKRLKKNEPRPPGWKYGMYPR